MSAQMIRHFERNVAGRDFIVGDVHGCFGKLNATLDDIGFDRARDRLFSVGDLIDRGPESKRALEWLAEPWFHAVMGNHEQMAVMFHVGDCNAHLYAMNGGAWFIAMTPDERFDYAAAFFDLPLVIELETEAGLVGIVHAACDYPSWEEFETALATAGGESVISNAIWGRDRPNGRRDGPVAGVRAVVVGHTPMERFTQLDNVLHVDTGGWLNGGKTTRPLTIIDAATLEPVTMAVALDWSEA